METSPATDTTRNQGQQQQGNCPNICIMPPTLAFSHNTWQVIPESFGSACIGQPLSCHAARIHVYGSHGRGTAAENRDKSSSASNDKVGIMQHMVTLGHRELPYAAWCQLKNGFKGLVVNLHSATTMITYISDQGGNSISPKTPYRKISQSLGGARSVVGVFQLLWNLAGV